MVIAWYAWKPKSCRNTFSGSALGSNHRENLDCETIMANFYSRLTGYGWLLYLMISYYIQYSMYFFILLVSWWVHSCPCKTKSLYTPWLIRICTGTGQYQNGSGISTGGSNFWKLYREMPRMQAWREHSKSRGKVEQNSPNSADPSSLTPPRPSKTHPWHMKQLYIYVYK